MVFMILDFWALSSVFVMLTVMFVIGIVILVARFFESPQLEQVAKTELIFAVSTALLILITFSLKEVVEPGMTGVLQKTISDALGYSPAIVGGDGNTISLQDKDLSLNSLTFLFMQPKLLCMRNALGALYDISIPSEATAAFYMEVFMSDVASGFIYKVLTERITNTTSIISFYLFIYYLIIHILNFLQFTALPLFFPMGVLLRSFPPSRGAGAYLIAFALGLHFVFPFSYILMDLMTVDYAHFCNIPNDYEAKISSCNAFDDSGYKEYESHFIKNKSGIEAVLTYISSDVVKGLTLSVCMIPIMAFTITLTFVLSSTSLFGGNIPEVGRGLIKLI